MAYRSHGRAVRCPLPTGALLGPRWRMLQSQSGTSIGLDFGAGSLKLVQVRWGRGLPRLESFAIMPLTPGAAGEGGIEKEDEVAARLRLTVRTLRLRQRRAGIVLGGPGVLLRHLTLPVLSDAELHYAMRFEAAQYLPIPEDQLIYDFATVPGAVVGPEGHASVFLAGTRRSLVQTYIDTLARARMRPEAAEIDCLAVARTLETLGLITPGAAEPFALLDAGESGTRISIFRYGVPMLTRTLPYGLGGLRQAVCDARGLEPAESEEHLRRSGFGLESPVWAAAERWLRALAETVQRSIEFFLIQHRPLAIGTIFACGGAALLPGFAGALGAELTEGMHGGTAGEAPAVRVIDLGGLDLAPAAAAALGLGPVLAAALGSALREGPA